MGRDVRDGNSEAGAGAAADGERPASALERIASFRFAYAAIFAFLLAYVFTLRGAERGLTAFFAREVAAAARVDAAKGDVAAQLDARVRAVLEESRWTRVGQVRVHAVVIAADGRTLLFAGGGGLPSLPASAADDAKLLPASADVAATIPYNSLLANDVRIVGVQGHDLIGEAL